MEIKTNLYSSPHSRETRVQSYMLQERRERRKRMAQYSFCLPVPLTEEKQSMLRQEIGYGEPYWGIVVKPQRVEVTVDNTIPKEVVGAIAAGYIEAYLHS